VDENSSRLTLTPSAIAGFRECGGAVTAEASEITWIEGIVTRPQRR
jgi:hypothetical protein